jgi:hypothetical protein
MLHVSNLAVSRQLVSAAILATGVTKERKTRYGLLNAGSQAHAKRLLNFSCQLSPYVR